MRKVIKTSRTSRPAYRRERNAGLYEKTEFDSGTVYRKGRTQKKYSRSATNGHFTVKRRIQTENINMFAVKGVISFISIIIVFTAVKFDSNYADNIKTALSENISYSEIGEITSKVEKIFDINKMENKENFNEGYYDFRIDENIIEQMNKE